MKTSIKSFLKVFLVLGFFLPPELKRMYWNRFFEKIFFFLFLIAVQVISDRNVNKRISHKNYVQLCQDNTSWKSSLKAHQQIPKKRCFEKYCSCDQACQFSALQGTPWQSYLENLTIDDKFINKRVRLFIHQTMCREQKIISTS